ncbi:GNAT family N-acetyltransferase [Lentisphaera marina]|uniref:GNAT family N-acetyltransferase n=1 Tax=Lentisphaera marina TaxID=1111041 RepID=UPI0023650153|nr:GNAT family N-acetyltransferase [Lentisphaera marina]MDD7986953.1 GNAT family N-acetyltransferase [Lentisphaera marina]
MKTKEISPSHKHFEALCRHLCEWIYEDYDYFKYLQLKWELIEQYDLAKQLHKKKRKRLALPKIFIATVKGELVGFCRLVPQIISERAELSPCLAQMFILEKYRKRGYGKKLIDDVCKVAKKLKHKQIYLKTEDQEKFYQSVNWESFDTWTKEKESFTLMKRAL